MKRAAAALAVAGALVVVPVPAGAVEREHHVGIDVGLALLAMSDKTDAGPGFGAHWAYGLSDAFNLMVEGGWSLVDTSASSGGASTPRTRPASIANLGVGVGYVFDVLTWVPYAGVLLGGYALAGGTLDSTQWIPGGAFAIGLDYRLSRSWAVGVALRQHMLATQVSTYPSFTHAFARVEYTWGW